MFRQVKTPVHHVQCKLCSVKFFYLETFQEHLRTFHHLTAIDWEDVAEEVDSCNCSLPYADLRQTAASPGLREMSGTCQACPKICQPSIALHKCLGLICGTDKQPSLNSSKRSKQSLQEIKVSEETWVCEFCYKTFQYFDGLEIHEQIQHGRKIYRV